MKRTDALAAMRYAGYHADSGARVRLLGERVARDAMDRAWSAGWQARVNGFPCGCRECAEHAS